jgi:hypothetical protein
MTPPVPIFDAALLAEQLAAVAPQIATPADTPMFRTAGDGAVLDRAGNVVAPTPPNKP